MKLWTAFKSAIYPMVTTVMVAIGLIMVVLLWQRINPGVDTFDDNDLPFSAAVDVDEVTDQICVKSQSFMSDKAIAIELAIKYDGLNTKNATIKRPCNPKINYIYNVIFS